MGVFTFGSDIPHAQTVGMLVHKSRGLQDARPGTHKIYMKLSTDESKSSGKAKVSI